MKMCRIIALFCVLSLVILAFTGCAANNPEVSGTYSSEIQETESTSPLSEPEVSDTPADTAETQETENESPWSEPIYGEEKDFVIMIEGMEEAVTMTHTELDFSHWPGAANVALYIDRERYDCGVFEGEYDIVPVESDGDPVCSLHVFPRVGETAQEALNETKTILESAERGELTGEGTMELDNYTALYITTSAGETDYFIDYSGGCIILSMSVKPEAIEGHGVRLAAMGRTVKIIA